MFPKVVASTTTSIRLPLHPSEINLSRLAWNRSFRTPLGTFRVNDNGDLDIIYGISKLVSEGNRFSASYILPPEIVLVGNNFQ